jgi:hypothetical protein
MRLSILGSALLLAALLFSGCTAPPAAAPTSVPSPAGGPSTVPSQPAPAPTTASPPAYPY